MLRHLYRLSITGREFAGANPTSLCPTKGREHPGQVATVSQGQHKEITQVHAMGNLV